MMLDQQLHLAWYLAMDRVHMPLIGGSIPACIMCRNGSRGEHSYGLRDKEHTT